jgi:hypothetical protein
MHFSLKKRINKNPKTSHRACIPCVCLHHSHMRHATTPQRHAKTSNNTVSYRIHTCVVIHHRAIAADPALIHGEERHRQIHGCCADIFTTSLLIRTSRCLAALSLENHIMLQIIIRREADHRPRGCRLFRLGMYASCVYVHCMYVRPCVMYVFVRMCFVCIHKCPRIAMWSETLLSAFVSARIWFHLGLYVRMQCCENTHVCLLCVCVCMCMCVHVCVFMCVCVHLCICHVCRRFFHVGIWKG